MIPINPLAMMLGSLFLLVSVICSAALAGLIVALLNQRARRFIFARGWWFGLLGVFLAAGSLPTFEFVRWQFNHWLDQRALNPRLNSEQVLGDLLLPAGTQVRIERLEPFRNLSGDTLPGGLQSLQRAQFDGEPAVVRGAAVRSLELGDTTGEAKLVEAIRLDGWLCSAEAAVTFRYSSAERFNPRAWQLKSCTLAPGSEVAGVTWAQPVAVHAVENRRWQLEPGDAPVRFQGLNLRLWNLWLDGPYGELQDWQGELVEPLQLGSMRYPAGTRVRAFQGNLLFSPITEAPAVDQRDGKPLEADLSVEQTAGGKVLGTHRNGDVGVIDWFKVAP